MKPILFIAVLLISPFSFAGEQCEREAVEAANTNAFSLHALYDVVKVEVQKPDLLAYAVTFTDDVAQPKDYETYDVILLKSDCSVVSLLPRLNL